MSAYAEKTREARLRRALYRQGYQLQKSRTRNARAVDFGGYMIINIATNVIEAGASPSAFVMNLDDVEAWVNDTTPAGEKGRASAALVT